MAHGSILDHSKALLPATTIAGAVTGIVTEPLALGSMPEPVRYLGLHANFLYGSGGTTVKAWIQTSFDGGATWFDIANFAFTTAALRKVAGVGVYIVAAAPATPTDGTLADNTINNGLLGYLVRVKYTTTGTYGGATSLEIKAVFK